MYGNYYGMNTYQSPYYPFVNPIAENTRNQTNLQTPAQTPSQANNGLLWVQGEAGAKAYLVAPNNTVTLWDSESPTIYIKSADINGMPSMRVLDFTERTTNAPKIPTEHICKCGDKFVSKEEFNALQAKFDDLADKFEEVKTKTTSKTKKVEVEE